MSGRSALRPIRKKQVFTTTAWSSRRKHQDRLGPGRGTTVRGELPVPAVDTSSSATIPTGNS
ncbi:MAG: hypothetical protein QOD46_909 [Actinomycetota bacterium]|nr:hypothetical protein [Actinomycetota bacterium]